ncbi:MAG TPA: hypothetical protein VHQ98_09485 [Gaiellaceae bacterium]|nr:hypothetical protein [Gaiellaceae bacterium]
MKAPAALGYGHSKLILVPLVIDVLGRAPAGPAELGTPTSAA